MFMEEGLPERLKLIYGWHSVAGPGGPVGGDVCLDEQAGPLLVRAGTDVSMDGVADRFGALEFGELDSEPGLDVLTCWAEKHEVVVCLWDLAGADGALVVVGAVEAVEAELCWELIVVEIPHQLAFAAPNFCHPLPDRRPVQLGSCDFGPSGLHGVGDEVMIDFAMRCCR